MKLNEHITFLVGADDVVRRKPDTEPIEKTLDHFHVAPHETLVVGDTEFDIIMGRRATEPTLAVSVMVTERVKSLRKQVPSASLTRWKSWCRVAFEPEG